MPDLSEFDEKSRFLLDKALEAVGTSTSDGGDPRKALINYLDHKWRGSGWIPQDVREAATGRQKEFPCKGICEAIFEITRLASEQGVVLETLWMDEKGFLRKGLISWHMRNDRKRSLKLTMAIASELLARVKAWGPARWERAKAVKCIGTQPELEDDAMEGASNLEPQPEGSPRMAQSVTNAPATPTITEGLALPAFENCHEQVESNESIQEEVQVRDKSASLSAPDRPFPNLDWDQVATTAVSPAAVVSEIVKTALEQRNKFTEAAERNLPVASGPLRPEETNRSIDDAPPDLPRQPGMPTRKRPANVIDLTDVPDHTPSSKRLREFSLPAETVKAVLEDPHAWLDDNTIDLLCSALQILYVGVRPIRVFPLQRMSKSTTAKLKKNLKEHLKASGDIFLMSEDVCKVAYHDSMYNAVAAEKARGEVEAWMKAVEIEKNIEFEFQNCPQQKDHSSCGVYAVSCFRRVLTSTHNGTLTRPASEERLSYLEMLTGMTQEQQGRLPTLYQSTVKDLCGYTTQRLDMTESEFFQDMDGKLARVSPQTLNRNLQDAKQQLEQLTRDERKANDNFITLQVRHDMGKRAEQGLNELAGLKEYAQPGQGTDVTSQLDITLQLQQEAAAEANECIRRCLDEFQVSEQQMEDAKMALLETRKQVEDAKANVQRVERLKEMADMYAQWSSDERRLECLEKDRALLEAKQEQIGQRLRGVIQEKTQLLAKQEMSRGERELLWKDVRKGKWLEKGWLDYLEPEEE
ncbi:hypothetical protein CEP54_014688 [Fusarium duplospermum]|uniref:Uncharacterized protein n=1 Tax=Fusarium duplospermum TaxID=1325734 RepID=A0A428NUF6_9HYPO|nr:hypothetical protein CEP54_014688 [Fusarium duplospermum]